MKPKKRTLLLLLAAAALGAGVADCVALTPEPGVTVKNFERLRVGMTVEEVEGIMGRPSDDDRPNEGLVAYAWQSKDIQIVVVFAADGSAVGGKAIEFFFDRAAKTAEAPRVRPRHHPPPSAPLTRAGPEAGSACLAARVLPV
jgi:hypothetical protein